MLLPLVLACTLTGRFKAVTKVFLGYAALVIGAGIVVTVSRGAWLSTALSLLIFFGGLLFQRHYRLASLLVLTVLIAGGFWAAPKAFVFQTRLENALPEAGSHNANSRPAIWRAAVKMWRDHPWWGVGPAHFDVRFRGYRPLEVGTNPQWAHNDYLNALADWGLAGAGLIVAAWALLAAGVARCWRSVRLSQADLGGRSGSNRFALVLGASAGLLAILFHSFVDFNFQIPANAILAVALMALLSSHLRFATDRCWVVVPVWGRVLASLLLGAGMLYLGIQGWRGAAEHYWLARAARAPRYSPETIENLKRAFARNPRNGNTAYAIGEAYQIRSREGGEYYQDFGGVDYRQLARLGMDWLARSQQLNPWHAYSFMRYGMCLDWLDRHEEADAYFNRAEELDPNGYYTLNQLGLHQIEREDYAAARAFFQRSLNLQERENPTPKIFLELAERKLTEAVSNDSSLSPIFLRPQPGMDPITR
jgi:tetratricopeptide (TPR) repeat protein